MSYKNQCYRIKFEKFPLMQEQYRYIMEGVHEACIDISIPPLAELGLTLDDVDMVWDVRDKLFDTLNPEGLHENQLAINTINSIYDAQPMIDLRAERDKLIAETDWWVLPDRTPTEEQLAYRQALRDITLKYDSLETVVWPEKP